MPFCSGSDEDEDAAAKARRLTERLRPAAADSAATATRGSAGAAVQQPAERDHAPQTGASAPQDGERSTQAAQTPGRKVSSGRISLGGALAAAQRNGGTAMAPQTDAADAPNVLTFVRQQQASVADRDWLFGGAHDGPGARSEPPAESDGKRSAAASTSRKGSRNDAMTQGSGAERREFIRAKKFSGEDLCSLLAELHGPRPLLAARARVTDHASVYTVGLLSRTW